MMTIAWMWSIMTDVSGWITQLHLVVAAAAEE